VSRDEDRDDVRCVLAGDLSAFEGIVRRWQGPLVNMAYRFCRDRGRAEDMAQEAFLRAYRALARWHEQAAFSTWLFALAANLYRTELRRIPLTFQSLDDAMDPPGASAASDGLDSRDRDRAVRRAVHALPAKYREAMVLFYFHEMDVGATARSLGVPEGTVKARLSRGRDMLSRALAPRFAAPPLKEPR
jgi:RNA polymerase sigma-70 factor (ECF subfamily)